MKQYKNLNFVNLSIEYNLSYLICIELLFIIIQNLIIEFIKK